MKWTTRDKKEIQENSMVKDIGKGVLGAMVVTIVMVMLFALVLWLFRISDGAIPVVNQIIKMLSLFFGGWIATRNHMNRGWLRGGLTGFAFILVTIIIGAIMDGRWSMGLPTLVDLLMGLACGGVSGMLAVNLKKR